ncbi:asialoglycoprotein receptor 1-like isoform X3 [Manis javanica]|uniref:asialoglycoprotein receptor 1-like isoform X3 n=1 Tax=Manis javanica TaxID=9974 RepID=UPI000812C64E|nr:asialoglycoprotein receptor 1-like isoform X3 [Manis javanica]
MAEAPASTPEEAQKPGTWVGIEQEQRNGLPWTQQCNDGDTILGNSEAGSRVGVWQRRKNRSHLWSLLVLVPPPCKNEEVREAQKKQKENRHTLEESTAGSISHSSTHAASAWVPAWIPSCYYLLPNVKETEDPRSQAAWLSDTKTSRTLVTFVTLPSVTQPSRISFFPNLVFAAQRTPEPQPPDPHSLHFSSSAGPSMSMKYEKFQHSESEKKIQEELITGLPLSQSFLQRLCSGPRPLLLSLSLSFFLLVGICVIGSQNFKSQRDLVMVRTTFRNFASNITAEMETLNSQGGSLQNKVTSLKAEVENNKQELQAGYSMLLLRVQQLIKGMNSLTCKMNALKNNGSQNTCCPTNWLEYQGTCYWFSDSEKNWFDAEKYCQLENAYLVVVNSRAEQNFIRDHLDSSFAWMGLSDPEGFWKWADGTDYESSYKNWEPSQPDNWEGHGMGGGEDCAHFLPSGKWNDNVCQKPFRWICEADLS